MTNSKTQKYFWPKYLTTFLITKLGTCMSKYQHYYYPYFCLIPIVSPSVYACVCLWQGVVHRPVNAGKKSCRTHPGCWILFLIKCTRYFYLWLLKYYFYIYIHYFCMYLFVCSVLFNIQMELFQLNHVFDHWSFWWCLESKVFLSWL